jgi:hypothetical protein
MRLDLDFLPEPVLQFGEGEAIAPKDGLTRFGPYSLTMGAAHPASVKVGLIGTADTIELARGFLRRCMRSVPSGLPDAKTAPTFPGFSSVFRSELITDAIFDVILDSASLDAAVNAEKRSFHETLSLLSDAIRRAAERDIRPDVIALCLPDEVKAKAGTYQLPPRKGSISNGDRTRFTASAAAKAGGQYSLFDLDEPGETLEDRALPDPADLIRRDLRRALKAAAMPHRIPIQILTPALFSDGTPRQQDPATRAWNLTVGLFYKAGGLPWRFQPAHEHTCYVGISFHHLRTTERHLVYASLAQAFSSYGDGFALRGAAMPWTERDTDVHLDHDDMFDLLSEVLSAYRERTGRDPLRVVIHKTTRFHDDERDGAHRALADIPLVELMTLSSGDFRVLRQGSYPPPRGSLARVGPTTFLFTGGYMSELGTYPGPHIPVPIELIPVGNLDMGQAAQDLLALTKLNWNNANPCAAFPITLSFARQVGSIMAEVPTGQTPHPAYRFYM